MGNKKHSELFALIWIIWYYFWFCCTGIWRKPTIEPWFFQSEWKSNMWYMNI